MLYLDLAQSFMDWVLLFFAFLFLFYFCLSNKETEVQKGAVI